MGVSYADVDLSQLPPTMDEILGRVWVRESPAPYSFQGYTTPRQNTLQIPDRPNLQTPNPYNTLVWPTGASRWAEYITFADGNAVTAIKTAIKNAPSPFQLPLKIADDTNDLSISAVMYPAYFKPLYIQNTSQQYWMVHFVDERFFWWRQRLLGLPGVTLSWNSFLSQLVTSTGTQGALDPIPTILPIYGTGPSARFSNVSTFGQPIPTIIDAVADTLGFRFIRRLDGTVAFVDAPSAFTQDENQFTLYESELVLGGRVGIEDIAGTIPTGVAVQFPHGSEGESSTLVPLGNLNSFLLPPLQTFPDVWPKPVGDWWAWLTGDLPADTPIPVTPGPWLNTLQEYGYQAGIAYYNWLLSFTDATFRSVQPITPTGYEDRIEWEYVAPRPQPQTNKLMVRESVNPRQLNARVLTRVVRRILADTNQYGAAAFFQRSTGSAGLGSIIISGHPVVNQLYYTSPSQVLVFGGLYTLTLPVVVSANPNVIPGPTPLAICVIWVEMFDPRSGFGWLPLSGSSMMVSAYIVLGGGSSTLTVTFSAPDNFQYRVGMSFRGSTQSQADLWGTGATLVPSNGNAPSPPFNNAVRDPGTLFRIGALDSQA